MITQQITDGTNACHYSYNGYNGYNNRYNLDSISSDITDGNSQITQSVHGVSRDVLQTHHSISKEIGDVRQEVGQNRYQLLQVNNDVSKQLCDVKESFNDKFAILLLENQKTEAKTREELLKGFADTQLDACKNANELAKQMAECCCETQKALLQQSASIRELELKQSAQTRELALAIENNRLRDKCDNQERNSRNGDIEIAVTNVLRNFNKN